MAPALVVLEVGPRSPWISRLLTATGHGVIVANPRKLRLIYENDQKFDRADAEYERLIREISEVDYLETTLLRQVPGVGPVTALCYILTLEDPDRFPSSRSVGLNPRLASRKRESGDASPQLRTTKAGDPMLRHLLSQATHYTLGSFGEDTDLRRWGEKIAERGGKNAKKRAIIAVARKLAVLLHSL